MLAHGTPKICKFALLARVALLVTLRADADAAALPDVDGEGAEDAAAAAESRTRDHEALCVHYRRALSSTGHLDGSELAAVARALELNARSISLLSDFDDAAARRVALSSVGGRDVVDHLLALVDETSDPLQLGASRHLLGVGVLKGGHWTAVLARHSRHGELVGFFHSEGNNTRTHRLAKVLTQELGPLLADQDTIVIMACVVPAGETLPVHLGALRVSADMRVADALAAADARVEAEAPAAGGSAEVARRR